ncbi:MAG: hypothetical protein M1820_007898 [Bogoriella megaspora]|nr:MAG: hypothetical protein M1820_007898 [Bogoriella megaspora]
MSSSNFASAINEAIDELGIAQPSTKRSHRGGRREKRRKEKCALAAQAELTASLVEVRRTESKGLGLFALKDLAAGTRIISEVPLLKMAKGNLLDCRWADHALTAFEELDAEKQAAMLNLHAGLGVKDLRKVVVEAMKAGQVGPIDVKIADIHDITDIEDPAFRGKIKVASTFASNLFVVEGSKDGPMAVIGELASRVNHACHPNVILSWNEKNQRINVHANRDVKEGEEIMFSYTDFMGSRKERQEKLAVRGFECDCETCGNDYADKRRQRYTQLIDSMGQDEEQVKHRKLSERENAGGLLEATEAMTLLDAEGVLTLSTVEVLHKMVGYHKAMGNLHSALDCVETEMANVAIILGTDCATYEMGVAEANKLRSELEKHGV